MRIDVGGVNVAFDRTGRGEPVVLIAGVASTRHSWRRPIEAISEHFEVVAFDNRLVGETQSDDARFSIPVLANDTRALMSALSIESAHIVGTSMGGMAAVELAVTSPQLLRSLTLISTHSGGPRVKTPSSAALRTLLNLALLKDASERARGFAGLLSGSSSFRDQLTEDVAQRMLSSPQLRPDAVVSQFLAIHDWTSKSRTWERLSELKTRTLVLHGSEDQLIPVSNARLLGSLIPSAKVEIFQGAGHGLLLEEPEAMSLKILEHLKHSLKESKLVDAVR